MGGLLSQEKIRGTEYNVLGDTKCALKYQLQTFGYAKGRLIYRW